LKIQKASKKIIFYKKQKLLKEYCANRDIRLFYKAIAAIMPEAFYILFILFETDFGIGGND
jgi:hypothetical protein